MPWRCWHYKKTKRDAIVLSVSQTIEKTLQEKGIQANVDAKTGRLILPDDTTFDQNQAVLKDEAKKNLDTLIPVYAEALFGVLTVEQQQSIDKIFIEGHTDKLGDYVNNMELSTKRANAILYHVYNMPAFAHKDELMHKLTAVGRGENDAVGDESTPNPTERKVVIRFDFKEGDEANADFNDKQGVVDKIQQIRGD